MGRCRRTQITSVGNATAASSLAAQYAALGQQSHNPPRGDVWRARTHRAKEDAEHLAPLATNTW